MSIDEYKTLKTLIDKRIADQTPLLGNLCHTCKSDVIKKVVGSVNGRLLYSFPQCAECGRIYFYARNVRIIGEKEFRELLRPLGVTR